MNCRRSPRLRHDGVFRCRLIRRKRDGATLDASQLHALAQGIGDGSWSEGQVGAFAMAVAWRGMSVGECRDFTVALCDSGRRLEWHELPGPVLDKHSTGGVGDGVSLLLAPLLAACGGDVPRINTCARRWIQVRPRSVLPGWCPRWVGPPICWSVRMRPWRWLRSSVRCWPRPRGMVLDSLLPGRDSSGGRMRDDGPR